MEKNRNKIIDWIVKIILVIIIILLLIHNCELSKKRNGEKYDNKESTPTGNVQIIEINCDKNECIVPSIVPKDDNKPDDSVTNVDNDNLGKDSNFSKDNTIPVDNQSNNENGNNDEPKLVVFDSEITWNGSAEAKIFKNSMYETEDFIAPEMSNTYQFIIKNGTEYKLKYNMSFIEDNPYNINMKYKLKKNDTYIVDHYVSFNELNVSDFILNSKSNDTYYLEWKWVSSDNDTEIGKTPDVNYSLKINVGAESTNE